MSTSKRARHEDFICASKWEKQWLTTSEAAVYLGSTPGGIRNRVYRRQIVPFHFHGRLMFKKADLDSLIEFSQKGE